MVVDVRGLLCSSLPIIIVLFLCCWYDAVLVWVVINTLFAQDVSNVHNRGERDALLVGCSRIMMDEGQD